MSGAAYRFSDGHHFNCASGHTRSIALPAILEEISEVIGLDAALAIAQARGGQEVYFPRNSGPDHWLAQCIGQTEAQTLCAYFSVGGSGIHILVPTGRNAVARVRAEETLGRGLSVAQVAAIAGVHERTVYRIKREMKQGN